MPRPALPAFACLANLRACRRSLSVSFLAFSLGGSSPAFSSYNSAHIATSRMRSESAPLAAQEQPSACFENDRGVAAWVERTGVPQRPTIHLGTLASNILNIRAPRPLSTSTADQLYPAVSCRGAFPVIAWMETTGDGSLGTLKVQFLDWDATQQSEPIVISPSARGTAAAIAYNGSDYLIAYTRAEGRLVTVRLNPFTRIVSIPLEVAGLPSYGGQVDPRLAWSGTTYLIAWDELEPSRCQITCPRTDPALDVRSLNALGAPIGSVLRLSNQVRSSVGLEWNGSAFVLVWHGYESDGIPRTRVMKLDAIGRPLVGLPGLELPPRTYPEAQGLALFTQGASLTLIYPNYDESYGMVPRVFEFDSRFQLHGAFDVTVKFPLSGALQITPVRTSGSTRAFLYRAYDQEHRVARLVVTYLSPMKINRRRSPR